MIILIALIAAIGVGSYVFRQRRTAPPDGDVVDGSRRVIRYRDDPAMFCDNDLVLDGVAFLLA